MTEMQTLDAPAKAFSDLSGFVSRLRFEDIPLRTMLTATLAKTTLTATLVRTMLAATLVRTTLTRRW